MNDVYNFINVEILVAFLIINLVIGIRAGRQVGSFRAYAVGIKAPPVAVLAATILATWVSGGTLFYVLSSTYTGGLKSIIIFTGEAISLLFIGQVLAIRMRRFSDALSVGEAMGDIYGPVVRVITGISGILGRLGPIAIQFQITGQMITLILAIQGPRATIAAATIVILYSAFGGIRSVTITDVLQAMTFGTFIQILAITAWSSLSDPHQQVAAVLADEMFDPRKLLSWDYKSLSFIGLMLYFSIPSLSPAAFQRIVMAQNVLEARRAFTSAAGIEFLIILVIAWTAIVLLASDATLDPQHLVDYAINNYTQVDMKGLTVIGISALAMSSADSDLNACSVLAVNDVLQPIFPSFKKSITTARICAVLIGTLGLTLAMYEGDLLKLMLLGSSFYMPVVTVPLLMAIFRFYSTPKAALIGMVAGIATVLLWRQYMSDSDIPAVLPGMLANLIGLMGTHYMLGEEGGWTAPVEAEEADETTEPVWGKLIAERMRLKRERAKKALENTQKLFFRKPT
ncbi:MAG: sodium:solute symporter family protein [Roseivirga sp.]